MNRFYLFTALVAVLGACTGGVPLWPQAEFTLEITDSPVDVAQKAIIRFTGAKFRLDLGDSPTASFTQPIDIDLLTLQDGNVFKLFDKYSVPANQYDYVELAVSAKRDFIMDSYIEINGAQYELVIPESEYSNLRMGHNITLDGRDYFVADFDLRNSIYRSADGSHFILRPKIRFMKTKYTGTVRGRVSQSVITSNCIGNNLGAVYIFKPSILPLDDVGGVNSQPINSARVKINTDGEFEFILSFMPTDDYILGYTCQPHEDEPDRDDPLLFINSSIFSVTAGSSTIIDFL